MATIFGVVLILVGLACWVRVYAILTSSNDPGDLRSRYDSSVNDSSVNKVTRNAGAAAYFAIGLIGLGFGISLL